MAKIERLPAHKRYQTSFSHTGELNMTSRKVKRTRAQRERAREVAQIVDGTHKVLPEDMDYVRTGKRREAKGDS